MPLKDLFKRKNKLDPRIEAKKDEIEKIIMSAQQDNRYSFFEFIEVEEILKKCERLNDYEKYEYFYSLFLNWNNESQLSRNAGELINRLMQDKTKTIAIHRTYLGEIETRNDTPTTFLLDSIMENGLLNNGQLSQGASVGLPSLTLTTTPISKLGDLINIVASYKGNNGTILLSFPRELVDEDLSFKNNSENTIYDIDTNSYTVKPEYILGVIIKQNGKLDEFYTREQLLNSKTKQ